VPKAGRIAGPICVVEHEFSTFKGNGLGLVSHCDRQARHGPRCRLWWRTVNKLAAIASQGKVYGVDFSGASVAFASRLNKQWIDAGRVEIQEASVSRLPFSEHVFDLVVAVETHFWWPDLSADMRELLRVLKPGGVLIIIAEVYKGANTVTAKLAEKYALLSGMKLLTANEHRELFANAGYSDIQIIEEPRKGWICGIGKKPC
jgi:SAM-dependent methyltransferase